MSAPGGVQSLLIKSPLVLGANRKQHPVPASAVPPPVPLTPTPLHASGEPPSSPAAASRTSPRYAVPEPPVGCEAYDDADAGQAEELRAAAHVSGCGDLLDHAWRAATGAVRPRLPTLPRPEQYSSYGRYAAALRAWRTRASHAITGLALPQPLGRLLARPRLAAGPDADHGIAVGSTVRRRLPAPPWIAQLVPDPPQPGLFPDRLAYETALCRWARACLAIPVAWPPAASSLSVLAPLRPPPVPAFSLLPAASPAVDPIQAIAPAARARREPNVWQVPGDKEAPVPLPLSANLRAFPGEPPHTARASLEAGSVAHAAPGEVVGHLVAQLAGRLGAQVRTAGVPNRPVLPALRPLVPERPSHPLVPAPPVGARLVLRCTGPDADVEWDWRTFYGDGAADSGFREAVRTALAGGDTAGQLEGLMSWARPEMSAAWLEQQRAELLAALARPPLAADAWLTSPCPLDRFARLLAEPAPDLPRQPVLSASLAALGYAGFRDALLLLQHSASPLTHAKLGWFVQETLLDSAAKQLLERLLLDSNLRALACASQAVQLVSPQPEIVYPMRETQVALLRQQHAAAGEALRFVLLLHYVEVLERVVQRRGLVPSATTALFLAEQRRTQSLLLDRLLQQHPDMLTVLFRAAANRSRTLAHAGCFVLAQLMRTADANVQRHLRAPQARLLARVRALAVGRFAHTAPMADVLFGLLQREPWRLLLQTSYSHEALRDDLLGPSVLCAANGEPGPATRHAVQMLQRVLEGASSAATLLALPYLADDRLFHELLVSVCRHELDNERAQALGSAVRVLVLLAQSYERLGQISLGLDKAVRRLGGELGLVRTPSAAAVLRAGGGSPFVLALAGADLRALLTAALEPRRSAAVLPFRSQLLRLLAILLRSPELFELIRVDATFFPRLLQALKEPHAEFNLHAHRLFFAIMQAHAGLHDTLAKQNVLQNFLEVANPALGNSAMAHSLHFLGKLFALGLLEQRLADSGQPPRRLAASPAQAVASAKEDARALLDFFRKRRLFIHLHMVAMRLLGGPAPTFPGSLFVELAALFHLIATSPMCAKLLKDIQRQPEYRDRMNRLLIMMQPPHQYLQSSPRSGTRVGTGSGVNGVAHPFS